MKTLDSKARIRRTGVWSCCLTACCVVGLMLLVALPLDSRDGSAAPGWPSPVDAKGAKYFDYGDANNDGIIDLGDAIYVLNYLFKGGPEPDPFEAGDANCDLVVDLADAIWLLNYLFKAGERPPCFSPSDPFDEDSLEHDLEMLQNSICDTGVTNVVWLTPVDPVYDTYTEMVGDTLVERCMCFFEVSAPDVGTFWRFPPPLEQTPQETWESSVVEKLGQWAAGLGLITASTYFHSARYRPSSGAPWQTRGIQIQGNQVMVGNNYFTFDDPSPLDPSLARQVLDKKYDPPPALTDQQISQACGEGAISIFNGRIVSAFYYKHKSWWSDTGDHCIERKCFSFLFAHDWKYECPDGPQTRSHFAMFDGYSSLRCDGTQVYYNSFCAIYHHVLQTM